MNAALTAWIRAGEHGDAEAARVALADDAVIVSPLTDQFVFRGRDEVVDLLRDVFEVVTATRYVRTARVESGAVLLAETRVDGLAMNEAQFVDLDEEGRIAAVTLFMRPLPASTRFLRRLGPRVARRQGNNGVARTLSLAGAFLDSVATSGDRTFVPMAAPTSTRRG
ncbi:nuclear transport factor 2 family protein [Nocardiopsis sp. NRRL B-16309]|uniref:nuclear transport factor 2 family protein n=1 Tax=Nocardiopsis sp. NRRL B-16309 TaxID=1519494 RepID=UPI0006AF7EBF|nr:nuclear transport factor 2 family protein [Nocardiopsis sp. NRRL B-16309]